MRNSALGLVVLLIMFGILLSGCAELKHFFGVEEEKSQTPQKPAQEEWSPDKSTPFTISGVISEKTTGQPIEGVNITAEYTIACPTKACNPFTEKISTVTNNKGEYALNIYQNFWDITMIKSKYNIEKIHLAKEEAFQNTVMALDVQLRQGTLKEMDGFVRDQGKRMIIDKGTTGGFPISLDGKAHLFEYLEIINQQDSQIYKALFLNHNKKVRLTGYVFLAENGKGLVEVVSFSPIDS